MSNDPGNVQVDPRTIERTRQHINRLIEEVARLAESPLPTSEFYGEMLQRVLQAMAAPAGVIWVRTPQGNLQLAFQINAREVGIDKTEAGRRSHDELLRKTVEGRQPTHLLPHSGEGAAVDGRPAPGNPTDYLLLLAPILLNGECAGIIEVWQSPERPLNAVPGFLSFMNTMAELATRYIRNQTMGQLIGQQQVWTQLETFARQVNGSLNPTEVAYHVANEGRRLVECDRVSVAVRDGWKAKIEAISGADVIESRSNLVVLMRQLADAVLKWNEKLVYSGTKDEALPPDVLTALNEYLAESNSRLLVVQPLRDEREKESKRPARAAIIMECFEAPADHQQLVSRMDVVARHSTPALYNAVEHRRVPLRFLWMPLAKLQDGLGGKTKATIIGISAGVVLVLLALILIPYELRVDSTGQLLPATRRYVYSPEEGAVVGIDIVPNQVIGEEHGLLRMASNNLHGRILQLDSDIKTADDILRTLESQLSSQLSPAERNRIDIQIQEKRSLRNLKDEERRELIQRTNSIPGQRGYYIVKSPRFTEQEKVNWSRWRRPEIGEAELTRPLGPQWSIISNDAREMLLNKTVQPSDPLLRLGELKGRWEVELRIPQQHIGQVLYAFNYLKTDVLEVELLVRSRPTQRYKGLLRKDRIGGEATPSHTDQNEPEPVVTAYVDIDGEGIDPKEAIPPELLTTGTEVRAKIVCGPHAMGYSLFYGVWEFLYEKVLFYF